MTNVINMRNKKKKIIDEICTCGHLKSQHLPVFVMGVATAEMYEGQDQSRKVQPIAQGHGACNVTTCDCSKFTWKGYVYE